MKFPKKFPTRPHFYKHFLKVKKSATTTLIPRFFFPVYTHHLIQICINALLYVYVIFILIAHVCCCLLTFNVCAYNVCTCCWFCKTSKILGTHRWLGSGVCQPPPTRSIKKNFIKKKKLYCFCLYIFCALLLLFVVAKHIHKGKTHKQK